MSAEPGPVDRHILEGQILVAVKLIMATYECGLSEATRYLYMRYDELREARPDDFAVSHEEYWKGAYS
ncbi:hypothetical protein GCM10022254_50100 [Actinomadura meridiana]|uniref:Uncharacterized protein n=1 Tax=Actinomadura meridiana TaxID=559626 RepID=A0ABP8CCI4_9ACTN